MKRYVRSTSPCPIGRASRILGDRWVLLILREAYLGADRFETFIERLPISRAALTSRLAMLTEAGLLARDPPDARRAAYRLTDAGRALQPAFLAIGEWAGDHLFEPGEALRVWGED